MCADLFQARRVAVLVHEAADEVVDLALSAGKRHGPEGHEMKAKVKRPQARRFGPLDPRGSRGPELGLGRRPVEGPQLV